MTARAAQPAVLWHDAECGAYEADLGDWERLADSRPGAILELGCGTGRVTLHLAARGQEVWAVDSEPDLLEALRERAAGLSVHPVFADAREISLERRFGLVLAPMQIIQLLGGAAGRRACLAAVAAHLEPGGLFAAAIVEGVPAGIDPPGDGAPLPGVREEAGWVYSSLVVFARATRAALEIERRRQVVSPDGDLREERHRDRLDLLDAETLEVEGRGVGLAPSRRVEVPSSDLHVGSTIVVMEKR